MKTFFSKLFKFQKSFEVYTDGSTKNGKSSWAFVIVKKDKIIFEAAGQQPYTSSNRMELRAAIEALKYFKKASSIWIYSDSKILVDGMRGGPEKPRPPAFESDFKRLEELCLAHKVYFKWIKAHSGNPFNERCDELCRSHHQSPKLLTKT